MFMSSPEISLPSEIIKPKKKSLELPDGETYDVSTARRTVEGVGRNPALAEKFKKAALGRAEDIFESGQLKEKIKEGDVVLYIGAGTGYVPQYIEQHTGAKIIKFDIADLRAADTKDSHYALANARRLPLRDASINTVCLFDILHHTRNQEEILKEALRVLKPGGTCLIMEDTIPESFQKGSGAKKWLVGKMDDVFNLQPRGVNPHNYHSISDWELMLQETGFAVDSNQTKSWHWGVPDFLGADRAKRPEHTTLSRPFEATMFEVMKAYDRGQDKEILDKNPQE